MKSYKSLLSITMLFLFATIQLAGQSRHLEPYILNIHTDSGITKGILTGMMESSIEVTGSKNQIRTIFPVSAINYITITKPFLKTGIDGLAVGAILGGAIVTNYYLAYNRDVSDPPFGRALWTTMAFGASVGLIYGTISSLFSHKKITIRKMQYLFENKKKKLNRYFSYKTLIQ